MGIIQRICKWAAALFVLGLVGLRSDVAFAQQASETSHSKYNLASACGDYAAIATYGANVARALGTVNFDGRGKLAGTAIVNQPGPNNTRTLTSIGIAGTYTMNSDGTGVMLLTITLPGGSTASVTEDFVISRANGVDGVAIATEIQDAQEQPSAVIDNSGLVIHSYTLRTAPKTCASGSY